MAKSIPLKILYWVFPLLLGGLLYYLAGFNYNRFAQILTIPTVVGLYAIMLLFKRGIFRRNSTPQA